MKVFLVNVKLFSVIKTLIYLSFSFMWVYVFQSHEGSYDADEGIPWN